MATSSSSPPPQPSALKKTHSFAAALPAKPAPTLAAAVAAARPSPAKPIPKAPQSAVLQGVHAAAPAAASSGSGAAAARNRVAAASGSGAADASGSGAAASGSGAADSSGKGSTQIPEQAGADIIDKLLALAAAIRSPKQYIGHSSFALFALLTSCRPKIWEGENLVDIVDTYCQGAPASQGCIAECAVHGVCCYFDGKQPEGEAQLQAVSETLPINKMNHYIGACKLEEGAAVAASDEGAPITRFYSRLGVTVLGTVTDGDCGIDLMCLMSGLGQTLAYRTALREQLSDFLLKHLTDPWMQDVMAVCQEIKAEELAIYRGTQLSLLTEGSQLRAVQVGHNGGSPTKNRERGRRYSKHR